MNVKINKVVLHSQMEQIYLSLVSTYHHTWVGFSWNQHHIWFDCDFMESFSVFKEIKLIWVGRKLRSVGGGQHN